MDSTNPNAKKPSLRHKVEAILYSVGRRTSLAEIVRLARSREDAVKEALIDLKKAYDEKDSSLILIEDGDFWKLAVKDSYLPVVKKIVTETELSKTVLETLAVIAFKYPIRQSDLIKIRTNKAYDHLKELEGQGFISRKKHGRTNLIKLTEKFFNYFDLPEEKLKEHLADFESIAKAITVREEELIKRKEQKKQELEDISSKESRIKQEIDSLEAVEPKVEPYGIGEQPEGLPKVEQKLGDLEVYTEPTDLIASQDTPDAIDEIVPSDEKSESEPLPLKTLPIDKQNAHKTIPPPKSAKDQGITTTPEMDREIDKKVERMLNPPSDEDGFPSPQLDRESDREEPSDVSNEESGEGTKQS